MQEIDTLSLDLSDILTISNAGMDYKSPGTFATDTEILLGLLFYLILEHIEIPEFVLGNAISGSKASADTQMPVFEMFIRMRQKDCAKWLLEIAKIVLRLLSITNPGIVIEDPVIQWIKLTQNDRLTLDAVSWAFGEGLLDERTALLLLPLDLERPEDVLRQARRDARRRERQQQTLEKERIDKFPRTVASIKSPNGSLTKELQDEISSILEGES